MKEINFSRLGYTERDIESMKKKFPLLLEYDLEAKLDDIMSLGYTRREAIKITKAMPSIYGHSLDDLKRKHENFVNAGFSYDQVTIILKNAPSLYGYSEKTITKKILDLCSLGLSMEDVIKVTTSVPTIFTYNVMKPTSTECNSEEISIQGKIEFLEQLGFTKKEVLKIVRDDPSIFTYSIENINSKIDELKRFYTDDETKNIMLGYSSVLDFSSSSIKEKMEFYHQRGLHSFALQNPKSLIQGLALSYAKYSFFKENGIKVTDENCASTLFLGTKLFEKRYGMTKDELLAEYDYEEYKYERNLISTQRIGRETLAVQKDSKYIYETEAHINRDLNRTRNDKQH